MDSPNPAPTDPRRRLALVAAVYLAPRGLRLDAAAVHAAIGAVCATTVP